MIGDIPAMPVARTAAPAATPSGPRACDRSAAPAIAVPVAPSSTSGEPRNRSETAPQPGAATRPTRAARATIWPIDARPKPSDW